jgi:glycosyltransferase involved in cell wall biosynthesis
MALNIPVIATRVVGIVDAVKDGVTGLLVPHGDAAALSSAILRVRERPQLKRELIQNASHFVRSKCARELMTARIESIYFGLEKSEK